MLQFTHDPCLCAGILVDNPLLVLLCLGHHVWPCSSSQLLDGNVEGYALQRTDKLRGEAVVTDDLQKSSEVMPICLCMRKHCWCGLSNRVHYSCQLTEASNTLLEMLKRIANELRQKQCWTQEMLPSSHVPNTAIICYRYRYMQEDLFHMPHLQYHSISMATGITPTCTHLVADCPQIDAPIGTLTQFPGLFDLTVAGDRPVVDVLELLHSN